MQDVAASRRPLKSRNTRWANAAARALARSGISPNAISVISVVFAAGAAVCLALAPRASSPVAGAALLVGAAAGVQLRLLCNLLDGMVAIEGGKKTKSGEVFNDLPDRIADPLILVGAGYGAAVPFGPTLGWTAALLAVFTAYVRLLGGSLGLPQDFGGPMAKQHRMAVITVAALAEAVLTPWPAAARHILRGALALIVAGSLLTIVLRVRRIIRGLEAR